MIRIIIENLLLFLVPTALYVGWVALTRDPKKPGGVMDEAPLIWLTLAGALLVVVTLVVFQDDKAGGRPGQGYEPPVMRKDGTIEPGQIK